MILSVLDEAKLKIVDPTYLITSLKEVHDNSMAVYVPVRKNVNNKQ